MKGYNISQLAIMLKQTSKQTRKRLDAKGIQPLQEIAVGKRTFAAYGEDAAVYVMSLRTQTEDRQTKVTAKATPVLPQDTVVIIDALVFIEKRMAVLEAKIDKLLELTTRIEENSGLFDGLANMDDHAEVA